MKVGIIYSKDRESIENYLIACEHNGIEYETIDLTCASWLEQVTNSNANFFIQRPEGNLEYLKCMYDERLYIITKILKKIVYPSYDEVKIYENKKFLSYFLDVKNYLHAKTDVFYLRKEAIDFVEKAEYPIVAKTSIGASGSGVEFLRNKKQAHKYIARAFGKKGITRRFGPNPNKGNMRSWISKALKSPQFFIKKVKNYIERNSIGQRNYVIFQEYIDHNFEWRVTKCGDYYYAYQKLKLFDKCSGTGVPDGHEVEPSFKLLDFVRRICEENNFFSMAIDILACRDGTLKINEMQTHWGVDHYDCMIIKGKKGIYKYDNGWQFIEGDFWENNFFNTRLSSAIEYYNKKQ